MQQQAPRLATPAQVAEYLITTEAALAQLRYRGLGPKFIKLGARRVRYSWAEVEAYVEAHTRTRTDQSSTPAA